MTAVDQAFEKLFRRYEQRLFAYCRSILRNDADAVDAVQNTAVNALVGMRERHVHSNARAWLFQIARNECLMLLRRRRVTDVLADEPVSEAADPVLRVLAREELEELVADLGDLPGRAREALILRETAGLAYGEIAGVLGTTPGAARQSVLEARGALRCAREARSADCETIRTLLGHADGRRRRSRTTRAHLRGCAACRAWSADRRVSVRLWMLPGFGGGLGSSGWLSVLLGSGRLDAVIALKANGGAAVGGRGAALLASAAAAAAAVMVPSNAAVHHKEAPKRTPVAVTASASRTTFAVTPTTKAPTSSARRATTSGTARSRPAPATTQTARATFRTAASPLQRQGDRTTARTDTAPDDRAPRLGAAGAGTQTMSARPRQGTAPAGQSQRATATAPASTQPPGTAATARAPMRHDGAEPRAEALASPPAVAAGASEQMHPDIARSPASPR